MMAPRANSSRVQPTLMLMAKLSPEPSSAVFQDEEPGVVVRAVDQAARVHEDVGGLDDAGAVGPMVHHARRRRRHPGADLVRPELIANVEHPHAGVLVGGKDDART